MKIYFLYCVVCYLVGSICFGKAIEALFGLEDLRSVGSGNIGATNVYRAGGAIPAAITLFLDCSKGFAVVSGLYYLSQNTSISILIFGKFSMALICGALAIIGHIRPLVMYQGGKGVATALGVTLGLSPLSALLGVIVWLNVFLLVRNVALSSLCMIWAMYIQIIKCEGGIFATIACMVFTFSFQMITFAHKRNFTH
ncbi:glycerol-3-phosphate acyltransferase [Candidatus Fokinia crypta]|uniref:Glycerol-3-phosphate acyltransferase n=1 Tax=Candidatus Fokinia crypta TaxID=1920990 RepID=A0ABZ0UR42_9RICK|nr:glycerol-3-phosphate acyltransferase [Candidatus Fokinia cryptica]WPX98042.1 putative glycerol-3-phosphate acyltransferase [Candidatus Fokinia cryptica]